jgi:hypothetical protein
MNKIAVVLIALAINSCVASVDRQPASSIRLIKCIDGILYTKDNTTNQKEALFHPNGDIKTCDTKVVSNDASMFERNGGYND